MLDINGLLTYVLAEMDYDGTEKCFYTLGADLISQERNGKTYTYFYDGHGSVVGLCDESGKVTDTYTYDAFGNLLKSTGRTTNNYRYCGEQFDSTTGLYYLRARYMDTSTGRFISQDSYAGSVYDPVSLHKYLYANSNPVMYIDPSGYFSLGSVVCASTIGNMLFYSASSGMIALGMNLIRQLNGIRNGVQECINLGDALVDAIIAMLVGGVFAGFGFIIFPHINSAFAQAIIYCAFGSLGVYSFLINLAAAISDFRNEDPNIRRLAIAELLLAGISAYGAKNCFRNAIELFSSNATATTVTDVSTENMNNNSPKYTVNDDGYYGERGQSSSSRVRNLKGGDNAAKEFFDEKTVGYISERLIENGVIREMPDGTHITYRSISNSDGTPAVSFNGGETTKPQKIHFID